ncbi:hypothetical protein [Streptomyces sp. URMC 124]|uniref:hypothetical protein n=1 Tax=Streptomyces sp. URMC 124 TaxID=3423405 RepID=UPI003F1A49C1
MVSAQLVFLARRTHRSVPGPSRLLWLALLLFGVLYTHGVSGESAVSHATGKPVALSAFAHAIDEHHAHGEPAPVAAPGVAEQTDASERHEDESSHGAEDCTSGKPQEGPALFAPGCSALCDALRAMSAHSRPGTRPSPAAPEAAPSATSRVLRI